MHSLSISADLDKDLLAFGNNLAPTNTVNPLYFTRFDVI